MDIEKAERHVRITIAASRIARLQSTIENWAMNLVMAIIMAEMLLITTDVVMRYVFNNPIIWAFPVVEIFMVCMVFLAIGYVQSIKGHLKVELLTKRLPEKASVALEVLGYLVGLFIFSIIAWQSSLLAWKAWLIGEYPLGIVRIPLWPGRALLTFGVGLLCLRLLLQVISDSAFLLGKRVNSSARGTE
ncbi:MAG: TRAP transporter small permease [Chloroflexi bacterium]|nr:TRAP transporter small permease [Chloroflexota bacterium]